MTLSTIPWTALTTLHRELTGPVLVPGDDAFTAAVRGRNLTYAHQPSLAVLVADARDVATAVRVAAEHRMPGANGWPRPGPNTRNLSTSESQAGHDSLGP